MDTDINDIWDLPVETSIRHLPADTPDGNGPGSTPPTRASNRPLFLPSDEEEEDAIATTSAGAPTSAEPQRPENTDIDALFEGLDDMDDVSFQELAPALDLDALRREADARNARAVRAEMAAMIPAAAATSKATGGKEGRGALDGINGEADDDNVDGKKKRKPVPRLDEARLLGQNGLPQLMKDTKNFKLRGKGHEVQFFLPFPHLMCRLTENPPRLRQRTWIACSKCTNSGPTNCIPKLDSRRR